MIFYLSPLIFACLRALCYICLYFLLNLATVEYVIQHEEETAAAVAGITTVSGNAGQSPISTDHQSHLVEDTTTATMCYEEVTQPDGGVDDAQFATYHVETAGETAVTVTIDDIRSSIKQGI